MFNHKGKVVLFLFILFMQRVFSAPRYVATGGSDLLNTCLLVATPCATIQHAISQAVAGDEIRVAQGTYTLTTQINLKNDVKLLGGYNAIFTSRDPNPATNNTIIEVTGATPDTAIYADSSITDTSTEVDGFTILAGNANTNYAVYIDGGKPTISNNIIKGGKGGTTEQYGIFITGAGAEPVIAGNTIYGNRTGANLGNSYGIWIDATGSPSAMITNNSIYGSEVGTSGSSYGIYVSSTNPGILIQNNTLIDGGTRNTSYGIYLEGGAQPTISASTAQTIKGGSGNSNQYGIFLTGTGTNPTIIGNTIYGNNTAATTGNSFAVTVNSTGNPSATIQNNTIYGSEAGTSGTATGVRVLSNSSGVEILGNYISGGTRGTSTAISVTDGNPLIARNRLYGGTGATLNRAILLFTSGSNTRIYNNLIHGGGAAGSNTRAVEVSSSSQVKFYHNTIYAGSTSAASRTGVFVNNSNSGVDIRNNIIFCANMGSEYGIRENTATSDPDIVQNNNIFRCVGGGLYFDENTTALTKVSEIAALGSGYTGNIKLDLVAGGAFVSLDGPDSNIDTLSDNNWNLVTNVPANLGQGGQNLSFDVPNDFAGIPRTVGTPDNPTNLNAGGFTIGAYENDNAAVTPPTTFYSRISGNWQDSETWSAAACGGVETWTPPVSGSTVIICTGHNVTQDIPAPLPGGFFPTFIVQNGATLSASDHTLRLTSFVADATATLSLSGSHKTVFGGGSGNIDLKGKPLRNAEINSIGTHTLQSPMQVTNDTGATNAFRLQAGTLDLNNHSLTVAQALNIYGGTLNATGSTINLGGSFYLHAGSFIAGTSTVVLTNMLSVFLGRSGSAGSAFVGANKLNKLQINAAPTATVRTSCSDLELTSELEILSGTLSLADTATGCNGVNRSLQVGTNLIVNGGNFIAGNTANPANTVSIGQDFHLLNGTINLANSNLTVNQHVNLSGGTLNQNQATISLGQNWNNTGATFTAGANPVSFTGSPALGIINTNGQSFSTVVINGAGLWQLSDNVTATGNLVVSNGTLSTQDKNVTVNGSVIIGDGVGAANSATLDGTNSTISVGGNWSRNITDGRYQRGGANMVDFTGSGTISNMEQTLGAENNFWNVKVAATGQTTTLGSQLTVKYQIQVGQGTLNLNGQSLWVYYGGGPSLPLSRHNAATFTGGGQIVYLFQTDNNGKVAGGNFGSTIITVRTLTGITAKLDSDLTTTGNFWIYGPNSGDRATFDLNGKNLTANNLFLGGGVDQLATLLSGNSNVTLTGNFTIGNQISAGSGNILITTGGTWSIGGNFTNNVNSGTVDLTGSTFLFNGTANQNINGTSPTTFYNLTLANSGARTITFPASMTHTVAGTFSATGSSGNVISLRSSTAGTQTTITVNGSLGSFSYLNIQDHVINGSAVTAAVNPPNSTDNGNNLGWFSIASGILYSLATGSWGDATKWTQAPCTAAVRPAALTVPGASHDVVICNGDSMSLSANTTVNSLQINEGMVDCTTSNYNLTVQNDFNIGDGVGAANTAILNPRAATISVGGSVVVNATDGQYQLGLPGTKLVLTGSGTHSIQIPMSIRRLEVTGPGTFNLLSSLTLNPAGFEISNGVFALGANHLNFQNGNFSQTGGNITATTGKIRFQSGTGSLSQTGGTLNAAMEINTTGTYTLGTNFSINGNLTKNNSGLLGLAGYNLTVASLDLIDGTFNQAGGTLTINGNYSQSGGTFHTSGTTIIAGNFTKTGGTFDAGTGLVRFTGSGAHTISNDNDFNHVEINATGTYTLAANLNAQGNLTINSGTLDTSAANYSLSAMSYNLSGGNLVLNNSTVNVNGSWNNTGTTVASGGSMVNFAATAGSPVIRSNGQAFATVNLNAAALVTYTLQDALSANSLSLLSGTLNTGTSNNINLATGIGFNGGNLVANGSTITFTGTNPQWNRMSGTFNAGTSTVKFNSAAASTAVVVNDETFYKLEVNNENLNLPSYTTVQNHFTVATNGTVLVPNNGTVTVGGNLSKSGTGILDIGGAGGSANFTVNGNLSITGGIIEARASTLHIKGNLSIGGATFQPGTSTVNLNGTSNQALSGNWTFHNLALQTATGGKTITFEAGSTTTVNQNLQASGSAGNILTLNSSVSGTQATITVNGPPMNPANYEYLSIKDHILNGSARTAPINPANSTDLGNNKGWFNAQILYTKGTGNWSMTSNWSEYGCGGTDNYGGGPLNSTDVVICNSHNITLDMAGMAKNFNMQGGSLDVSGGDLTLEGDFSITSGTISISDGRNISVKGHFNQSGGNIQNTGVSLSGEFILAAIGSGSYTISQSGGSFTSRFVINSSQDYTLLTNLNVSQLMKNGSGTFNLNNFNLSLTGDFTINAGTVNGGSGNLAVAGDLSLAGGTLNGNSATIIFNGSNLNLGGGTFNPNSSTMVIGSTVTLNGGSTFYNLTVNGSLSMSAINRTITNNLLIGATAGSINLPDGITLTVNNFNKQGGTLVLGPTGDTTLIVNGTYSHTGGTITVATGDILRVPNALGAGIASRISLHKDNSYSADIPDNPANYGYLFPYHKVHIKVEDPSRNLDANTVDSLSVIITSTGGENEQIALTETGNSTGVFVSPAAGISTAYVNPTPNNNTVEGLVDQVISLNYIDLYDSLDNHTSNPYDTRLADGSYKRWAQVGGGDWQVAANWAPPGVPTATDKVRLDHLLVSTPYTVNLTANASVLDFVMDGTIDLNLGNFAFDVHGNFQQYSGNITGVGANISFVGSLGPYEIRASGPWSGVNVGFNSPANYSIESDLSFSGNFAKMGAGTVFLNGQLQVGNNLNHFSGGFSFANRTVVVYGGVNLSSTYDATNSTFVWMGNSNALLQATQLHHFKHYGSGTLTIPNNSQVDIFGDFEKTAGTLVVGPTGNSSIIFWGAFEHKGGIIVANMGDMLRKVKSELTLYRKNFTKPLVNSSQEAGYYPTQNIEIQLVDKNRNLDSSQAETVQVSISTTSGESETITLVETNQNSGVFRGVFQSFLASPMPNDGQIQISEGDILTVTYQDPFDLVSPDISVFETRIGPSVLANAKLTPDSAKIADNYFDFRFKKRTFLGFNLSKSGRMVIELYDLKGRKIKTLADANFEDGDNFLEWDVGNAQIPSGLYFVYFTSPNWRKPIMYQIMVVR